MFGDLVLLRGRDGPGERWGLARGRDAELLRPGPKRLDGVQSGRGVRPGRRRGGRLGGADDRELDGIGGRDVRIGEQDLGQLGADLERLAPLDDLTARPRPEGQGRAAEVHERGGHDYAARP
jgi:hypothetical protein